MLIIFRAVTLTGKTTIAKEMRKYEAQHLSSDYCRELITGNPLNQSVNKQAFDLLHSMLETRMKNGVFTIYDATNLKWQDAKKAIKIAKQYNRPYAVLSIKPPCITELKKRSRYRCDETGFCIPDEVIEKHYIRYYEALPTFKEKLGDNFFECEAKDAKTYYNAIVMGLFSRAGMAEFIGWTQALWTIGDVHGCYEELEELILGIHDLSEQEGVEPVIYQLGDWIDRGPSLEKTFDVLEKYNVKTLLGNHEDSFLRELRGEIECRSNARKESHKEFSKLPEEKQRAIVGRMENSPYIVTAVRLGEPNKKGLTCFLTHGGTNWNLLSGKGYQASRLDCITSNLRKTAGYGKPCNEVLEYFDAMQVHGHSHWEYENIADQLAAKKVDINVDSGCVYGKGLVAFSPTLKLYTIADSKSVYTKE